MNMVLKKAFGRFLFFKLYHFVKFKQSKNIHVAKFAFRQNSTESLL